MIVADAPLLISVLTDGGSTGQSARRVFAESKVVYVPDVAYLETVAILRRQWLRGSFLADRCRAAIKDLGDLPLSSCPTGPLMPRAFALWGHMTTHEASYAALAEALGCDLVTADQGLVGASGPWCRIRTIGQTVEEDTET
jgi:predicted nucleic acid-binding protein